MANFTQVFVELRFCFFNFLFTHSLLSFYEILVVLGSNGWKPTYSQNIIIIEMNIYFFEKLIDILKS